MNDWRNRLTTDLAAADARLNRGREEMAAAGDDRARAIAEAVAACQETLGGAWGTKRRAVAEVAAAIGPSGVSLKAVDTALARVSAGKPSPEDILIKSLAEQVRYMQVCYMQRSDLDSGARLGAAESMLATALRAADGDRENADFYDEWQAALVEGTPDAIGLTDMAAGTPRKGGSWRDYRPVQG